MNLFAVHRLRDEGATLGFVGCRGDAAYPVPAKLYQSVRCREISRQLASRRLS